MKAYIDFPEESGTRLQLGFSRPLQILTAHSVDEVTGVIDRAEQAARAGCWVTGFIAYESAPAFDHSLQIRPLSADSIHPLVCFAVFDQPAEETGPVPGNFACTAWEMDTSREQVDDVVGRIHQDILMGRYYQANYTCRLRADFSGDAWGLFKALQRSQAGGYSMFLDAGEWQIASVSPELFFDWQPDKSVLVTRPMKGTAPRFSDLIADARSAQALRASAKDQSENLMIVDLLRSDLGRVATTGTVTVSELFRVEALPTVWQMTSTVQCKTSRDVTLADILRALFPSGSVTGAPKVAAMAAIAGLEHAPRGVYCGAVGIIRPGGHATFNVGIRTVRTDRNLGIAECGIGSGIVFDSTAAGEYAEWLMKRRFLLRASSSFKLLETLRLQEGQYWLLEGHLQRLQRSAEYFGFRVNPGRVRQALAGFAASHTAGSWRVRLLSDREGALEVEGYMMEPAPEEIMVALASQPVDSRDELLRYKTTDRAVYENRLSTLDVFDTLLWNELGYITEFTRGNVVVELDGQRITPPVDDGLLPGVLRQDLLDSGQIVERQLSKALLQQATRIWFINSVRGWLPARLVSPAE